MEHQSHVSESPHRSEKKDSEVKQFDFNKLKEKPQRQITVDGDHGSMGVSDMNLLYYGKDILCLTDRSGHKTNTLPSGELNVWDICWSSFLDRFLILTPTTLHSLNVQTKKVTQIKQVSDKNKTAFRRCTCSNHTLLVSFEHRGSVVDEWDMSGEWKMMRRWQPPVSCQQNEWIFDIRFSCDGSRLGVTVWVNDQYNQVQVRDRSMNILNNITFPCHLAFGYFLLSVPSGQWLTHEWKNKALRIIDRDGILQQTLTYDKSVRTTALLGQRCLVIRTDDNELCFHDLC
ncbi:unnamed protein product [Didymodactylos carnosus]|uniref:Uncharacterized protein n=1 Tax=Didymodactylos carnosus TaxID=1234261 RepID=A0A815YJF9_9BILA|nr:unnamed protein product [Didymodactylos carnosus]CAF4436276.1 unnamed protein product [Didymodactylos carnosus]